MELSERMMIERFELGDAQQDRALRSRGGLGPSVLVIALTLVAAALAVATVQAVQGWADLVVLGVLVMTTAGLMTAIGSDRRR